MESKEAKEDLTFEERNGANMHFRLNGESIIKLNKCVKYLSHKEDKRVTMTDVIRRGIRRIYSEISDEIKSNDLNK